MKYGTDKPDLRNPLIIQDINQFISRDDVKFDIFKNWFKRSESKSIILKTQKTNQEVFLDSITMAKDQGASGRAIFFRKKQKYIWKGSSW